MAERIWWQDTRPWRVADDLVDDWNPGEWNTTSGGAGRTGRLADVYGNVWEVNITTGLDNDFLTNDDRRRLDRAERAAERAEPDAESEPTGRRGANQTRSRVDSDTVWRRMDRALEMADLMADTHGHVLAREESAVNRSGRLRNRERTGYDWIETRAKDVREHFFASASISSRP